MLLLWLWHRPAAIAPIGLLAWELPFAAPAALKSKKKKKKKKRFREFSDAVGYGSNTVDTAALITAVVWVVQSLAWELLYAASTAQKNLKKFILQTALPHPF